MVGCDSIQWPRVCATASARSRSERLGEPRLAFEFCGSRQREPCIHENALLQVGGIDDDRADDETSPAGGDEHDS